MKIARFVLDGKVLAGVLRGEDSITYFPNTSLTVEALVAGDAEASAAFGALARGVDGTHAVALADICLMAPIGTTPNNIFCVGLNYRKHVEEGVRLTTLDETITAPTFFTKKARTITSPNGDIPLWTHVTEALDYEIELAVVIGKSGRDICAAQAMDHVFGYCIADDISARDAQFRHGGQRFKGKSLDGTLPLGPWITTRDEIPDPRQLLLSLTVNGEMRQQAQVGEMIFDIPLLIEQLSAGLTLDAGDIILTGTPSGAGAALSPPTYLKAGDVVKCTISNPGSSQKKSKEISLMDFNKNIPFNFQSWNQNSAHSINRCVLAAW
jgi:2-keto-4-pentenoate hydratase/2-oxohepta-3-ene-1,7-dioic acid hydratase in catechol pathway